MDGIIKARCLFENDMGFRAKKKDYEILSEIWTEIINSWIDGKKIRNVPLDERINYLPENCQWLYDNICESKGSMTRLEVQEIGMKKLTKNEFREAYIILKDHNLIVEKKDTVRPYWMTEEEQVALI